MSIPRGSVGQRTVGFSITVLRFLRMPVRDAVEADIPRIAELIDTSQRSVKRMIHERTIRVYCDDADEQVMALVSFDASKDAVQIAHLAGNRDQYAVLLCEPIRFGDQEDLPVDFAVSLSDQEIIEVMADAGFERREDGPTFRGEQIAVFRYDT